jgi:hypothetical protein
MKTREEMVYDLTVYELKWFVDYVEYYLDHTSANNNWRETSYKEMAEFFIKGGFNNFDDEVLAKAWRRTFTDEDEDQEGGQS